MSKREIATMCGRIIVSFVITIMITVASYSQESYKFINSTGSYTNLSGATSLNNGQLWDDPEYQIPIGFNLEFFDQTFDSLYVSDYVWFDASVKYRVYAYESDFIDLGTTSSLSNISYLLSGSPGSQILKIEWNNVGFYDDSVLTDFINVQLWLYEGSNAVEIRVGPNSVLNPNSYGGNEAGVVGLVDKIAGKNVYLIGDSDSPSQTTVTLGTPNLYTTPVNGTIYRFEQCPSASFTYTLDSAYTINVTSGFSSDISSYYWDFGDSSGDTGQIQSHTYLDTGTYIVMLITFSNCDPDTTTQQIVVSNTIGIDQYALLNHQLDIYPNPTNSLLHILLEAHPALVQVIDDGKILVELIDLIGRPIYWEEIPLLNGSAKSIIDISEINTGAYFIRVLAGEMLFYQKIIKY